MLNKFRYLYYVATTLFRLKKKSLIYYLTYKMKLKCYRIAYFKNFFCFKNSFFEIVSNCSQTVVFTGCFSNDFNDEFFNSHVIQEASILKSGKIKFFYKDVYNLGSPPRWFFFPEHEEQKNWIDFEVNKIQGHDVKLTWDLSRFSWLVYFGAAYAATGDDKWLKTATSWVNDWLGQNPYEQSVNWVCAQECSIRAINFLLFLNLINTKLSINEREFIIGFLCSHIKRIKETILYSISQDNNHAISEASALLIGSGWLINNLALSVPVKRELENTLLLGYKVLSERLQSLVFYDGGFSMYSTNYHRSVLNTLIIVDYFISTLNLKRLDNSCYEACKRLTLWLCKVCDPISGGVPNLGANDGSLPFLIQCLDYSDYRTTAHTASFVFLGKKGFDLHEVECSLYWLGLKSQVNFSVDENKCISPDLFYDSGFVKYTVNSLKVFLKFPTYEFRPSQCDLFHIDVWYDGNNVLRDLGSFSYNDSSGCAGSLAKLDKHNTVCVDNHDAMPRLGRFLLGCWPKTQGLCVRDNYFEASYRSVFGYTHKRIVKLYENKILIFDCVNGAKNNVSLNFNIPNVFWFSASDSVKSELAEIKITSAYLISTSLKQGSESRYYNHLDKIFHFVASLKPVNGKATVITKVTLGEEML